MDGALLKQSEASPSPTFVLIPVVKGRASCRSLGCHVKETPVEELIDAHVLQRLTRLAALLLILAVMLLSSGSLARCNPGIVNKQGGSRRRQWQQAAAVCQQASEAHPALVQHACWYLEQHQPSAK